MEEFVHITSGGEQLLGVWTEPDVPKRVPATVVTLAGWGGYRIGPHRIIVKLCRALAAAGVASLRFDFRGRGDSTGDQKDTTLDMMIEDACRAVEFARVRAPENRVTLWGICSGSNVAIGAATLKPEARELVLLSCLPFMQQKVVSEKVARTKTQAGNYFRKLFRLATWKKLFTGAVNFGNVKKALFGHYGKPKDAARDPRDSARDILAEFASYEGRAHFVYGGADREAAGAGEHYRTFTGQHNIAADFETLDGANHDFYSLAWEHAIIERTLQRVTESAG
ncbi:MAG TPA: alpha/beta fold hydrolase [Planctomycetota bacterium]|nr:alpha/beta fold hydrolase [Planctomycetota bacterium]HUV39736.1 alpha/beta fold hydrolase [Planctomycetota bacterium]